jgi:hypothetical protein
VRPTLAHLIDPPKKHTTMDKTKPLGSQRVGHENEQLGVIGLGYLVAPSGIGKY